MDDEGRSVVLEAGAEAEGQRLDAYLARGIATDNTSFGTYAVHTPAAEGRMVR